MSEIGAAIKTLGESLNNFTDILNVGRLIFYTAAGLCGILPFAMGLHMLSIKSVDLNYWTQFYNDIDPLLKLWQFWVVAGIFGFIIAVLANAVTRLSSPPLDNDARTDYFAFQYPSLKNAGQLPANPGTDDYATWLIMEYYRYYEIALFIPYGILLSLPVYSIYSLAYLFRVLELNSPLGAAGYVAFALWTFLALFAWTVFWPQYWVPKVVEPTYQSWVLARRRLIKGLDDFRKKKP